MGLAAQYSCKCWTGASFTFCVFSSNKDIFIIKWCRNRDRLIQKYSEHGKLSVWRTTESLLNAFTAQMILTSIPALFYCIKLHILFGRRKCPISEIYQKPVDKLLLASLYEDLILSPDSAAVSSPSSGKLTVTSKLRLACPFEWACEPAWMITVISYHYNLFTESFLTLSSTQWVKKIFLCLTDYWAQCIMCESFHSRVRLLWKF